ncbi:hypothetical protein AURDEDRAFT_171294 [Auricularia subglabra TFB-10046 SS5]|nr:hypothetical protein AURDEDRAFT_171294 [Auricularia subglabra TFB-10046 SS5]
MTRFFVNALLRVLSSTSVDVDGKKRRSLFSTMRLAAVQLDVMIVVPASSVAGVAPLAHGALVRVSGWAKKIGNTVLIMNPELLFVSEGVSLSTDVASRL